jgi:aerobic C4-dicarboxylate transport protein
LILGIDRFMSEGRAVTNIIGNGVATIVIARWENALDRERLAAELAAGSQGILLSEPAAAYAVRR